MNSSGSTSTAPSRLASSRLKNPKLWRETLPVHSDSLKHTHIAERPKKELAHPRNNPPKPLIRLPSTFFKRGLLAVISLITLTVLITTVQPSLIQNTPFPDWYGPFHLLSLFAAFSCLFAVSSQFKTSLILAAWFQTIVFFKLQHVHLTPIVLLLSLILFGTIGFSAHLIQIITSKHKRATTPPTLHTLS